jgi:hypothetical protein
MAKVDLSLLGFCGIYCGTCDIYEACKAGNVQAQQAIADWLKQHYNAECTAAEIRCSGCHGPLEEHWSEGCKVRQCAAARGVATCLDCGEYETCTTLETFYRGGEYESARKTLRRIREVGIDRWVKEMEARLERRARRRK